MKVLLVNIVYGFGSTGKIMEDLSAGLEVQKIQVVVAYGRGKGNDKQEVIKLASERVFKVQSLFSKLTGLGYCCSKFSTHALFRLIEKERPDVVNLHCVNGNLLNLATTIAYLKQHHIKTVLSIHAEFPYTGGCGHSLDCNLWKTGCHDCPQFHSADSQLPSSYFFDRTATQWKLMQKAYQNFHELTVTCVSPWLAERAKLSPFFIGRRIVSVLNGLNTEIFRPRNFKHLKEKHQLGGKKVILHVTPDFYSPIKGGKFIVQVAQCLKHDLPSARLIICGYNGSGDDLPDNVIPICFTRDQEELAEYYSMADLTLLTSQKETFSMVCAESLCCGTPIVGFKAGGPESISLPEYSEFVNYGHFDALYTVMLKWIEKPKDRSISVLANKSYSIETMTANYKAVYNELIQNDQNLY